MKSYQLLRRLFAEQCQIEENGVIALVPKPSSDSLQNPSDPDAGYSGHKGKGYQAQVVETCDADNAFEVITHVKVESACESDSAAVQDVINDLDASDVKPETLHADTSYGGQDNLDAALDKDVVLNAPTSHGQSSRSTVTIDDFEFSSDGRKVIFKFMAINVRRLIKHAQNAEKQADLSGSGGLSSLFMTISSCFNSEFCLERVAG